AIGDDGDRSSTGRGVDVERASMAEVGGRVTVAPARHERDELDGEPRQARAPEQGGAGEPAVAIRLGGELEPAAVAARVREASGQAPEIDAPAVDGQLQLDALRRQDRPQAPVQVHPPSPDVLGRVRVALDGRIETEADI